MQTFENQTLNHRVFSRLRDMITQGIIPLGEQLDEQALTQELGVSRTPLREAIGKLVKEGLVEHRPYRGNFVRSFSAKQVSDLFEVRKVLEGLAIRLAIAKLTDAHVAAFRAILDDVQAALDTDDMLAYSAADRGFHNLVRDIADNESLTEVLDRLSVQIQVVRTIANRDPDVVLQTAQERPQILAALAARDAVLAGQLLEAHIEGVRRRVIAQLEARDAGESLMHERALPTTVR